MIKKLLKFFGLKILELCILWIFVLGVSQVGRWVTRFSWEHSILSFLLGILIIIPIGFVLWSLIPFSIWLIEINWKLINNGKGLKWTERVLKKCGW